MYVYGSVENSVNIPCVHIRLHTITIIIINYLNYLIMVSLDTVWLEIIEGFLYKILPRIQRKELMNVHAR